MPTSNKTRKNKSKKKDSQQKRRIQSGRNEILRSVKCVQVFLGILNMVKLYHWKTHSYAQHKSTDDLYSSMNEHIDKFVEIMLGKNETRLENKPIHFELSNTSSIHEFKEQIYNYREFLISLNSVLDKEKDSDLLNVRDEILGDINQFLYLLTFDK
jgi:hypothetical protein